MKKKRKIEEPAIEGTDGESKDDDGNDENDEDEDENGASD